MQKVIQEILQAVAGDLTEEQLRKLDNVLQIKLYERQKKEIVPVNNDWQRVLKMFLATKKLENCSNGTIDAYRRCIVMLMQSIGKKLKDITVNDLRYYLARYQQDRHIGLSYLETLRHYLSSFFGWCADEGYTLHNPARRLNRVKVPRKYKKAFTAEERERLKIAAKTGRDVAIMEVLYSTAGRIGEVVSLNRDAVNLADRSILLYGQKGKADRRVYLTEQATFYLKKYLGTRTDSDPALFVGARAPHRRVSVAAVQAMLRKLGELTGIHTHPHKFRRTLLTDAGARGIPLQEIQYYAGHVKPDTTMLYVQVKDEAVQSSFRRLIA